MRRIRTVWRVDYTSEMAIYSGEMADYIRAKRDYTDETAVNRRRIENDRGEIAISGGAEGSYRPEMVDTICENAGRTGPKPNDSGAVDDHFHVRRVCSGESPGCRGENAGYLGRIVPEPEILRLTGR